MPEDEDEDSEEEGDAVDGRGGFQRHHIRDHRRLNSQSLSPVEKSGKTFHGIKTFS